MRRQLFDPLPLFSIREGDREEIEMLRETEIGREMYMRLAESKIVEGRWKCRDDAINYIASPAPCANRRCRPNLLRR